MKNKTTRFLSVSIVVIIALCVSVFSFLAYYMNRKSMETISEVGTIYMTGMNERISIHFQTAIETRLAQVEALAKLYPQDTDMEAEKESLAYNAKARELDYLALCSESGEFQMLYGDRIEIIDPQPFVESLKQGVKKVAVGTDSAGNRLVLMAIPASYVMSDGRPCAALVAGIPADYIRDILALDENNTLVYSHIIRMDGSFVIRSADAYRESYFDRIRGTFGEAEKEKAEWYVSQLAQAMSRDEEYS